MANLSWGRRLFLTTLGGLAGLFIVYLALAIALGAAVQAMSIFSPGSFSSWGTLIFFGLAPALIIFGAAITAWTLGARLWRGLLAGVVALGAFAFLEVGQANYSPFNVRETRILSKIAVVSWQAEQRGASVRQSAQQARGWSRG